MKLKGKLFFMEVNPETERKTIRFEIEVSETQFDYFKDCWCNGDEFNINVEER